MINEGSSSKIFKIFTNNGLQMIFPNLYILLKIGITLPVSSASTERSFSKLKIIKNRLRTTMGEERLKGLMVTSSEADLLDAEKIDYVKIMDLFTKNAPD